MGKIALFGAGKLGAKAFGEYRDSVVCFIDNNKAGNTYLGKMVLSLDDYINAYYHVGDIKVIVCVYDFNSIVDSLIKQNIVFSLYHEIYCNAEDVLSEEIKHEKWSQKLKELCDHEGYEVLEIGSRIVTGANFRNLFEYAKYTGFDLYAGPNVDVVGDAHELTKYFDKKFDLIFCSAVFEHFAMPWIVADEIIKLCKMNGYIFVETHYSYSSHERPWHFFQFSEQALKVLFSETRGIRCIEAGVCNPIVGWFTDEASEYLRRRFVNRLYCHSDFLGQKIADIEDLTWKCVDKNMGIYPQPK